MKKGESVILIRPGSYRISYILPCVMEKGRKMGEAEIELKISTDEMFSILEKKFKEMKYYPDLPAADISWEGKKIVVFTSESRQKKFASVKIMKAKDREDVVKTTEMLCKVFGEGG